MGLVFTQISISIIRGGFIANPPFHKATPLINSLVPTPTTPLVASKTSPIVGNTESTTLLILLAGLLISGMLMEGLVLFNLRCKGNPEPPGDPFPTQEPPPEPLDENSPTRPTSNAGAPPPPPPDVETETIPKPRQKWRFPWTVLLAIIAFLGALIIYYVMHRWTKQAILWCAEWIGATLRSVFCLLFIEIVLWLASKVKGFYYSRLAAIQSRFARIVICGILGGLVIFSALYPGHAFSCFVPILRLLYMLFGSIIVKIVQWFMITYNIVKITLDLSTPTNWKSGVILAIILRLYNYINTSENRRFAAISAQIREVIERSEALSARQSAISTAGESGHHVKLRPVELFGVLPTQSALTGLTETRPVSTDFILRGNWICSLDSISTRSACDSFLLELQIYLIVFPVPIITYLGSLFASPDHDSVVIPFSIMGFSSGKLRFPSPQGVRMVMGGNHDCTFGDSTPFQQEDLNTGDRSNTRDHPFGAKLTSHTELECLIPLARLKYIQITHYYFDLVMVTIMSPIRNSTFHSKPRCIFLYIHLVHIGHAHLLGLSLIIFLFSSVSKT
ncbi:hypothetical protein BDZ94DRAFT_1233139 [Collybia nuda]|uniref:Uncharacterized protein n=1 Tax=Collybia nuda TaxID=64659 RepID=A0A9P5YDN6_9AGAR|nr:hypothetical protein BDZ94DRAFT_1233139 [Collybia nuda]